VLLRRRHWSSQPERFRIVAREALSQALPLPVDMGSLGAVTHSVIARLLPDTTSHDS
jgi:hypothetical protein